MATKNPSPRFVIEPSEVETLMQSHGAAAAVDLLPLLVPAAQRLARPPISRFHVGAAALGASGRIYLGINLEFPGLPLHHSVHAEQFLVASAALHGEPSLLSLSVSSAPCGHCRQFLQELRNSSSIRILVTSDRSPSFRPLADFLPSPFGPPDLLENDLPLLLERHDNEFDLDPDLDLVDGDGEKRICNGVGGMEGRLRDKAAEGARGAHAPYSGCYSGCAVGDGEGRVYFGGYMESAAYNPSLGPVQAAMVAYVATGGGDFGRITAAAVVEKEGAVVSHEGTAKVFFEKVAPGAELRVHRFRG